MKMKELMPRARRWFLAGYWLVSVANALGADFTVTSPDFFYDINGAEPNPVLTLVRGKTYTFLINADPVHPFFIASDGVVNNGINSGTITYTVPNVASNYVYFCKLHGFGNQIITVPSESSPPPPPIIRIVGMDVGTNVVLRSTGTNNWTLFPEFVTNATSTNWQALTVRSNRFLLGTNETFCGKPPGNSVFMRIRAQAQ